MVGQLHVGSSCNGSKPLSVASFPVGGTSAASAHLPKWITARLPLAQRFIKFCFVGGSGVFVDMGILFLLADPRSLGLNITFSKICAAEIALINNFIWNELWTFRNTSPSGSRPSTLDSRRSLARRFFLFNAICGIGIGLAVLLLHLFHGWLGWNLYLSNLLAIILVTCWNFVMNARFNWCIAGSRL